MSFSDQLGYSAYPTASLPTTSQLLHLGVCSPLSATASDSGSTGADPALQPAAHSAPNNHNNHSNADNSPINFSAPSAIPVSPPSTLCSAASLLAYPRVASGLSDTMNSLYSSAYAAQGYVPFGSDPSAFYSPLQGAGTNTDAWRNLSQGTTWPYDPVMAAYPYTTGYGGLDVRRKNATREATSTLKAWLYEHIKNPYPTKGEKIMLAIITKMTLTQVSTWFANARRRLKKENKMQWSPRNRTGDDDDDDKDDSDAEEEEEAREGGRRREEREEEDEDIVVDGSCTTDRNSSPGRSENDASLRDTSASSLDISGLSGTSHTSLPGGPHTLPALNPYMLPAHSQSLSHTLKDPYSVEDHEQSKDNCSSQSKPRIWSMADMATSTPQSPQLDLRRSPVAIAQSLINKSGYTAFSSVSSAGLSNAPHPGLPTSHSHQPPHCPHPVFNGSASYNMFGASQGSSSSDQAATLASYRLGGYLQGSPAGAMLPNFHRPSSLNPLVGAPSAACPGSHRLDTAMLGGGFDSTGVTPGGPCTGLDDTATAFKPAARRS